MSDAKSAPLHGSAVLMKTGGVLLLGASGSGKSSLAAQLIEVYGGQLIADDRVHLRAADGALYAAPPPLLAGQLELRGLGVVALAHVSEAALALCVRLVARQNVPRVAPEAFFTHQDATLPELALHSHDRATPSVIMQALAHLPQTGFRQSGTYGADDNPSNRK